MCLQHPIIRGANMAKIARIEDNLDSAADRRIKVIFNTRNFGHIRSPYYGMLQAHGDAMIYLASDLQDPPETIEKFIPLWEQGWKVVAAIKNQSEESAIFFLARKAYYHLIASLT